MKPTKEHNVRTLLEDLDAGVFEQRVAAALAEVASASSPSRGSDSAGLRRPKSPRCWRTSSPATGAPRSRWPT